MDPYADLDEKYGFSGTRPQQAAPAAPAADPYADLDQKHGLAPPAAPADNRGVVTRFSEAVLPYARRIEQGVTLGFGDEMRSATQTPAEMLRLGTWNPVTAYRSYKAREDAAQAQARKDTGIGGDIAEIGGAIALNPTMGARAALAMGGGRLARAAGFGAEGAALGAASSAGTAQNMAEVPKEMLRGGALGGVFGGTIGAVSRAPLSRSAAKTPDNDELAAEATRRYQERDQIDTAFTSQAFSDRVQAVNQAVRNAYGRDAPKTEKKLNELVAEALTDQQRAAAANAGRGTPNVPARFGQGSNPWQATVAPRDINSVRREIFEAAENAGPRDFRAATQSARAVQDMLDNPNAATIARGTVADMQEAARLDALARANAGANIRSRIVNQLRDEALERSSTTHSGLNIENTLKQTFAKARRKGEFDHATPREEAGYDLLIKGLARDNALRELGNQLGGGGGLGRSIIMGGGGAIGGGLAAGATGQVDPTTGALIGLGAGLTGRGIRSYGNYRTTKRADELSELLRQRSPLYAERAAQAPTIYGVPRGTRAAINASVIDTEMRRAIAESLMNEYQNTNTRSR